MLYSNYRVKKGPKQGPLRVLDQLDKLQMDTEIWQGFVLSWYSGVSQDNVNSFRENHFCAKTLSCEMRFPIGMH